MRDSPAATVDPSETVPVHPSEACTGDEGRQCVECGVRCRFLAGYEPNWSGWWRGKCPACVHEDARRAAEALSREEQKALVLAVLKEGRPLRMVERITGVDGGLIRAVRSRDIHDGILPKTPTAKPKPPITSSTRDATHHIRGQALTAPARSVRT